MNTGAFYEERAVQFLENRNYRVLERNFRTPLGEIDVVARDGDSVVFIEVKARNCASWCGPEEAVTEKKRRRVCAAARFYVARHGQKFYRFDVVAVTQGRCWRTYRLIKDAFREDEDV